MPGQRESKQKNNDGIIKERFPDVGEVHGGHISSVEFLFDIYIGKLVHSSSIKATNFNTFNKTFRI